MRTMYDSVTPSAIPTNAALVAGYINGPFAWSAAEWARFPHSVKVRISVRAGTNDGHVCDCEQGDLTPAQAVRWVVMRRKAGADPSVYCNASTWPTVQTAFRNAGVAQPHYWIAHYDGSTAIPAGAMAKQYDSPPKSGGNYDISVVADYWPGVDPEVDELSAESDRRIHDYVDAKISEVLDDVRNVRHYTDAKTSEVLSTVKSIAAQLTAQAATINALTQAVAAQHQMSVDDVQKAIAAELEKAQGGQSAGGTSAS